MNESMHENTPLGFTSRQVLKRLLVGTIILAILIGITISSIYYLEVGREKQKISQDEVHIVSMVREVFQIHIDPVVADLLILSENEKVRELFGNDTDVDRRALAQQVLSYSREKLMLSYSSRKAVFDQIRILDNDGMETLRVNFIDGVSYLVPENELQKKGERYYFRDIIELNQGEVYVSPLDLNIERGEIERPLKPIIRLGTPILDSNGQKVGVIILNYVALDLFTHLETIITSPVQREMNILNPEGYWLKGPIEEAEWGFMFEDRKNSTFGNAFPETWQQLSSGNIGQFDTEDGLFTFDKVFPLAEGMRSSTGSGRPFQPSEAWIEHNAYHWIIVTRITPTVLVENPNQILMNLFYLGGIMFIVSTSMLWFLFHSSANRKLAENALRRSHDELEVRVKERTAEVVKVNETLLLENKERKKAEWALGERMKELTCLYGIGKLVEDPDNGMDEILSGIISIIPPGWQYPDITCARIRALDNAKIIEGKRLFESSNFKETEWKQSADIKVYGKKIGTVEVYYLEEKPKFDEGPFLKEERDLLNSIAKVIGETTERKKAEAEKSRVMNEVARSIAHDIRNPLHAIRTAGSLLADATKKEKKELLALIDRDVVYADGVVKNLMDFSTLPPPKLLLQDINEVLKETLSQIIIPKNVRISTSYGDIPPVMIDKEQMNRALSNLLTNSIQAVYSGGELKISTLLGKDMVEIRIKDTGVGIPKEDTKKIFDPFYTTKAKGTGLGLPSVKRIVESHSGTIQVESKVGKGTEVTICIPTGQN